MRAAKFAATLAIAAACVFCLYDCTAKPYLINQSKKIVQIVTEDAFRTGKTSAYASIARENVEKLRRWIAASPQDVDLYMLLAANLRLLGRFSEATNAYESALAWDRRPEIYFNLGLTQIEAGRRVEGTKNLAKAARFSPDYLTLVVNPGVRADAERETQQ